MILFTVDVRTLRYKQERENNVADTEMEYLLHLLTYKKHITHNLRI